LPGSASKDAIMSRSPHSNSRRIALTPLLVAAFFAMATPAHAQTLVRGLVLDHGTGAPIVTVDIQFVDSAGVVRARR
jgi:hypothetical protein